MTPIASLSDEILLVIFQLSCPHRPTPWRCQGKPRLILSWVSKIWRTLTLRSPTFWNHINYTRPRALIDTILTRSQPAKLDVKIKYKDEGEEGEDEIAFIFTTLPRINSLHIVTGEKEYRWRMCQMILTSLPEWKTETHSLTVLSLSHVCLPRRLFGGACPSLSTVELMHCQFSWANFPLLSGLKSFKVVSPTKLASITQVIAVFRTMPNLTTVELDKIFSQGVEMDTDIESEYRESDVEDEEAEGSAKGGSNLGGPKGLESGSASDDKEPIDPPALSDLGPVSLDNLHKFHVVESNGCASLTSLLSRIRMPSVVNLSIKSFGDTRPIPIFQGIVGTRTLDNATWQIRSLKIVTGRTSVQYTLREKGGRRTFLLLGQDSPTMEDITDVLNLLELQDTRRLSVEFFVKAVRPFPYSSSSFLSFFETLGKLHISSLIIHDEHTTGFLTFMENVIEKSPKVRVHNGNGVSYYRCKPGTGAGSDDEDGTLFYSLRDLHFRKGFARGAMKHWKVLLRWLANYREGVRIDTLTFEGFTTPPPSSVMEEFRKVVKDVVLL